MKQENIHSSAKPENTSPNEVHYEDTVAQSKVSDSGNSNVDVQIKIDIDVKPIAFAMLYSLLASKQLTDLQFEEALKRLEDFS